MALLSYFSAPFLIAILSSIRRELHYSAHRSWLCHYQQKLLIALLLLLFVFSLPCHTNTSTLSSRTCMHRHTLQKPSKSSCLSDWNSWNKRIKNQHAKRLQSNSEHHQHSRGKDLMNRWKVRELTACYLVWARLRAPQFYNIGLVTMEIAMNVK